MNRRTDVCREMSLSANVEVVEDWWETLRARLAEAPLPSYRAVLFFESLTEAEKQFNMFVNWMAPDKSDVARRVAYWDAHYIQFTSLQHDKDAILRHAGCEYCDVFILDEKWSMFEMQYIVTRIRSQCGLQGKLFMEGENES